MFIKKRLMKKKKNVYAFLIKKSLYMLDLAQNKKHSATAKQLLRKNSAFCLKITQFFSQSEGIDRLDPPPRVCFSSLFKYPTPSLLPFLNNPYIPIETRQIYALQIS